MRILTPLITLPPETAHVAALFAFRRRVWRALAPLLRVDDPRLRTTLAGVPLRNPIGLAAGYDKNAECLPGLAALGFGYVTCGTITESLRPGNPKPRLVRYQRDEALANSLGFPNKGLDYAARQIERALPHMRDTPIITSVSGDAPDEIARCYRRLEPLVAAIELDISSPNTRGLRELQQSATLSDLLALLDRNRRKALLVKLPRYAEPPADSPMRRARRERAHRSQHATRQRRKPCRRRRRD